MTDSDEAILLAALEQFALTGVRRTSTDDIARRAGVNRATLYRRLGTKDEIVGAAYLFEATRVLAGIESAIAGIEDLDEYIATFFIATLRGVRENRLLAQMLLVDRDETVRSLTSGAGGILAMASAFLVGKIEAIRMRHAAAQGREPDLGDVEALAGVLSRLTQSLLLTPEGPPLVDTDEQMREFARTLLAPMIKGR